MQLFYPPFSVIGYRHAVFAAVVVFFIEWIRRLKTRGEDVSPLARNFHRLCFFMSIQLFVHWTRTMVYDEPSIVHIRHLIWVCQLMSYAFYLETLGIFLNVDSRPFRWAKKVSYLLAVLFVGFEIHFALTGSSLLFVNVPRPNANMFNILTGIHTTSPTLLMKVLVGMLTIMVFYFGAQLLRAAYRSESVGWGLKLGLILTLTLDINEILNSLGFVESLSLMFLSMNIEIFTIGEHLARENRMKMRQLKHQVELVSQRAATAFIASGMIHDLRTPLTVLIAHLSKVRTAARKTKELEQYPKSTSLQDIENLLSKSADKMNLQTERLQEIISSYLELLRETNQRSVQILNLDDLVNGALELCEPRLRSSGVSSVFVEPIPELRLRGVKVQIEMIFANILNNALEAIKGRADGWVRVSFDVQDDKISVLISNLGMIKQDILKKIHQEEGVSTKGLEGNGIGLKIVKELCRSNEAKLQISQEGEATQFQVTFPVYDYSHPWETASKMAFEASHGVSPML